jgi:hypothetical protein
MLLTDKPKFGTLDFFVEDGFSDLDNSFFDDLVISSPLTTSGLVHVVPAVGEKALEGLEVPCEPSVFKKRWKERRTVDQVRSASIQSSTLLPLELENPKTDTEGALLLALSNIGVVEFRSEERINMPDIFRVEARIRRRGGVRPPTGRR